MICEQATGLISAYQDRELPAGLRADLEAHLRDCESCATAFKRNLQISEAIRYQAPTFAPPDSLLSGISARVDGRPAWRPFSVGFSLGLGAAAAMAYFLFVPKSSGFTQELVSDHVRSLMANHLVDVVSSDRHTVKPWFLGKLDFAPLVPELRPQGYPLLGGRLEYVGGHPAAALVYGKQKHVINVLVMPESEGDSPGGETNGYRVVHWQLGNLGYWAVSDISAEDLNSFAAAFKRSG